MNVAVIGAGWAGLSAAFELHDKGNQVTVFEAGHRLGGRARGLRSPKLDAALDNGQHIMLGAYADTLALMRRLGLDPDELLYSMPLALQSADASFALRVPNVRGPLALPAALLGAKGMNWRERLQLVSLMAGLARPGLAWRGLTRPGAARREWQVGPAPAPAHEPGCGKDTASGPTVAEWLSRGRQSPRLIRNFWEPLCLASMNTPLDRACAQLFANVLRDSLGAGPGACRVLIPRVDLSSLWPEELPAGIRVVRGHAVRRLETPGLHTPDSVDPEGPINGTSFNAARHGAQEHGRPFDAADRDARTGHRAVGALDGGIRVDGRPFDAAIIATNVQPARRLLGQLPAAEGSAQFLSLLDAFQPLPIATLTLELSGLWDMPHPMLMLADSPRKGRFGQWLFHCNAFLAQPLATSRLNIVISNAVGLRDLDEGQVVEGVLAQIHEQTAGMPPMPALRAHELITEKRATFAAVPGLKRPSNVTPWKHIYIAGDWTDTGYPAVLEGAVRSGLKAAQLLAAARDRNARGRP